MSVGERAIAVGVLVSAAIACGWLFHTPPTSTRAARAEQSPHEKMQASALSLVPPGAAFVLTADVRQLRSAPLGELLAQRLGRVENATALTAACGVDPLARLDQLALAVPNASLAPQEHPEDFGIVAQGRFSAVEIMHCASTVITQHGGEVVASQRGRFHSLRDRKQSAEIAATDGTLIVSGGSYFRELLDAAEGHAISKPDTRDARHAELRRALGPGTIEATWLLGEHWFGRVAGDDDDARRSPLSALRAVGARIVISDVAQVRLLLDCTDDEGARRIASSLTGLRASLRALPLDPSLSALAERVGVDQTGARLQLAVDVSRVELEALLGLLIGP